MPLEDLQYFYRKYQLNAPRGPAVAEKSLKQLMLALEMYIGEQYGK